MSGYGTPSAPHPSPAIQTGFYANPANRGVAIGDLIGKLPQYSSFEQALTDPTVAGLPDEGKTNYLRDVYGLGGDYKVQNGQIVKTNPHPWLVPALAGAAMFAPEILGAFGVGGGAGAAALGPSTAANIAATGAAASAVPGSLAVGTAAATGGSMGLSSLWDTIIGKGADAALNAYGQHQQIGASDRAAQLLADYNNKSLDFLKSTEAERQKEWAQQQQQLKDAWAADQARRAPYRQAGQSALVSLAQMAGLQAPTTALAPPSDAPPPGWVPGSSSSLVPLSSLLPSSALSPTAPMDGTMVPPRKVAQFPNAPIYGAI